MKRHRSHKHINLFLLAASAVVAYMLSQYVPFQQFLLQLGAYGYVGAVLAGFLFSCSFTVTIGAVILAILAQKLPPWQIGLLAGVGGMTADLTIFHIIRDDIMEDLAPVYKKLGGSHLTKILHTKYFRWTLPVIGALIIMSPLPDELGVSLMDIAGMRASRFLLLSYVLNTSGMFMVAWAANTVKI